MHRTAVAGLAILAAVASLGAAGCQATPDAARGVASAPIRTTPAQAVAATLDGLDAGYFRAARVGAPPTGPVRTGRWFYASITDTRAPVPVSFWEASLAQGAVAERLAGATRDLRHVISGSTFTDVTGSNEDDKLSSGAGDVRSGRVYGANSETDRHIVAHAVSVLDSYGVTPETVRVVHPLGPALLVRAQVARAEAMHGHFAAMVMALEADLTRFEGIYVALDTPTDGSIAIGWNALRAGSGGQWFRPGDEAALGMFPHG